MNKSLIYIKMPVLIILVFVNNTIFAQTVMKRDSSIAGNVVVVKKYNPAVLDVHKIPFSPKVVDTVKPEIHFNYFLETRPVQTHYDIMPIHAAKVLPEPLTKLYDNCFKLGYGNYTTPLFEYCYSSNRSKKYSLNVHLKHFSSGGKLKLDNYDGDKAYAGFSNNFADINAKYFVKPHTQIQAGVKYNRDVVHNYGFNTKLLPDTLPKKDDYKQRYWDISTYFRFLNTYNSKYHFNYNTGVYYDYLENLQKGNQHTIEIDATMSQYHKKELIGGDIFVGTYIFDNAINTSGTADAKVLVKASPWVKVKGKKWQISAGLDIVNDHYNDSSFYHFYPNVLLAFNLVEDFFSPYLGVSGKTEVNHYAKLIKENPFISPKINVHNTNNIFTGTVGLKGKTSQKLRYNFCLDYSIIDDAYFFVNDTSEKYDNLFITERDDIEQLTISGNIFWNKSKKLNFLLKGEYFQYTMSKLKYAWHKPDYKITFSTYYNIRDKFVVRFDVYGIGQQYAKDFYNADGFVKLDGIVDVNLGIEYRYNKKISAFINFNNITAQRYYKWNQYPNQGFNVLGGLSYAF